MKQQIKYIDSRRSKKNKDTTNYETENPQVAEENVDFYYHKVLYTMKALIILSLVLVYSICLPSSAPATSNPPIVYRTNVGRLTIEVDPRVELIGIVFRLAGNPEYNNGTLRSYVKAIERHFGDIDGRPVVKMAAQLRKTRLMSCDGPMSLAVYIDRDFRPRKLLNNGPGDSIADGRNRRRLNSLSSSGNLPPRRNSTNSTRPIPRCTKRAFVPAGP